jgi:rhodanese-related sulfurtransferase
MMIVVLLLSAALLAGCTGNDNAAASAPAATEPGQTETSAALSMQTEAEAMLITPEEAREMIGEDDVTLLDVRTQEEYDAAHIEGAQLLPYDAIAQRADELPQDKDAAVIVYCRSGSRSAAAAQTLVGLGYTQVYDLGGIQSWPYETVAG